MILRRSHRIDPRFALGWALALALPLSPHSAALAQTMPNATPPGAVQAPIPQAPVPFLPAAPAAAPTATDAEALKQHDQELDAARAQERESAESQAKLRREIDALGDDRRALNQQLIDTAARVRAVEASIEATRTR